MRTVRVNQEIAKDMAARVNRLRTSIWRTIHGTGFARNVVVLTGGTALGQSLGVLTSPLLTRLYAPEDFGVLGVYTSIFSVLTVVSALCYEQAIPLPEADEAAANVLALSLVIVLATSFLAGLGIVLWGEQIAAWTNTPGLESYLWLLPLSMLGAGAYQALNYWMARKRHFAILSYTKSVRTLGQVGMQVALGLVHLESMGLIIGHVASQFLGALSLLKRSSLQRSAIAPGKWPTLGKTYANFPLFTVWTSLINVVGTQAPVLLFARYFTLDTAGFFSQTMRVLGLPAALIGQAVAQVFYPRVARHEGEPSAMGRFIQQVATSLFVLSFTVFSVVALHGADLFAWALGDQWDTAGLYAQYLAPWFMIAFVSSPLSSFALVKGKQRDNFFYGCFLTVSRLGAIWLGIRYASPDLSVILFSVVNVLFYFAYIAWILNLAGSSLMTWLWSIKAPILGGILLLVGLLAAKSLLGPVLSLAVSTSGLGLFGLWFWLGSRMSAASE